LSFRSERQPWPPTALQWGREEAATLHPTTVHATDPEVSLGIHNKTLLSEARGFAGRCPSYINVFFAYGY